MAQGRVINLPSAVSRDVIALYQDRWHLKSNTEYLSVGKPAIAHDDRLLKICFVPHSGHMHVENYLQAKTRGRKSVYTYACVCV